MNPALTLGRLSSAGMVTSATGISLLVMDDFLVVADGRRLRDALRYRALLHESNHIT
jgi:hypothetical protein